MKTHLRMNSTHKRPACGHPARHWSFARAAPLRHHAFTSLKRREPLHMRRRAALHTAHRRRVVALAARSGMILLAPWAFVSTGASALGA